MFRRFFLLHRNSQRVAPAAADRDFINLVSVLLMVCVWFAVKKKKRSALYTKKRKLQTFDTRNLQG